MNIHPRWGRQIQYDPTTLLIAAVGATAFSATSSIAGGINANSAAKQEAELQQQQAELSLKNAKDNATVEAYNSTQLVQRQKVAYLANGVSLEGSPSEVLKNTTDLSQQNVQAILDRGLNEYNLGQQQAAQTRNKGRAALVGGVTDAVRTTATAAAAAYSSGAFDSGPMSGYKVTGTGKLPSNTAPYKAPKF